MRATAWGWLAWLALFIGGCGAPPDAGAPDGVRFPARSVFRLGHDPHWAENAFDDRDWSPARLDRSWHRQGLVPGWRVGFEGWYRIHFVVEPDALSRGWVISAGHVGTMSELWLNGRKLGGVGSFDRAEVTAQRVVHAAVVPPGWLNAGTNLFAVRVRNSVAEGGILGGPVGLHPVETFLRAWRHRELEREVPRAMLAALCFGWALVPWLLRWAGNDRREFAGASVPAFLLGLQVLLFTQWMNSHANREASAFMALLVWLTSAAVPASVYGLMHNLTDRSRFWDVWVVAGTVVYLPLSLGAAVDLPRLMVAYIGFMLWIMTAVIARSRRAPPERRWFTRALLSGALALGICGTLDASLAFFPILPLAAMWWDPMDLGLLAFLGTLGGALSRRHVVARRRESELGRRLVGAHAEERQQLGRVLHDGVLQDILYWRQRAELASQDHPPGEARETLDRLHEGLGAAARDLRRLAEDLQPLASRELPLHEALARLAERFRLRHGIPVLLDVAPLPPVGERIAETLHRIAHEAVNNACRHAGAPEIRVAAGGDPGGVWIEIRDHGRGFDPKVALRPGHLGLGFLRDHAEWAGGVLTVDSAPGRGTVVRATFPVAQPKPMIPA